MKELKYCYICTNYVTTYTRTYVTACLIEHILHKLYSLVLITKHWSVYNH